MTAKQSWFFEKIAEIRNAAEDIETESDSFSDTFSDAQHIQNAANELDTQLRILFNEIRGFLRNIAEGRGIDEKKLSMLLYLLGE